MDLISGNPFRVLGLPISATDRQVSKRFDDLSMFCEMGKLKRYDTDFEFIAPLERTPESIQRAASQIELIDQKLFHSIFWFWDCNSVDELVFDLLNAGNIRKAKEIWEKVARNGDLSAKNYSSFRNLAVLKITLSSLADGDRLGMFLDAIRLLTKCINDISFSKFVTVVVGPNYKFSADDTLMHIADEVYKMVNAAGENQHGAILHQFITAFEGSSNQVIQYVRGKFTNEPVHRLESMILMCQEEKQNDSSSIYSAAKSLYTASLKNLQNLERMITKQDMQYQFIADKVANELLRSSTEHFNSLIKIDESSTPLDQAREITLWAGEIAASPNVQKTIEDDLNQIEDIRKDREQTDKNAQIFDLCNQFSELFQLLPKPNDISDFQLQSLPDKISKFADGSIQIINKIKTIGGDDHKDYLYLSDVVAGTVLGICVLIANETEKYRAALEILDKIKNLEMSDETKIRLDKNHAVLITNLISSTPLYTSKIKNKIEIEYPSKSTGCYIATLVYGNYESPEVLILRHFRDEVLARTFAGRFFIRVYYAVSPSLVVLLRNRLHVQNLVRQLLNHFIRIIS